MPPQAELVTAFSGYGPVWMLVAVLLTALGIGLWNMARWVKQREDRMMTIDESFKAKMATQIERQTDILHTQSQTLAVLAETTEQQGKLIDDLHKLSKEWTLFKKDLKQ